MISCAPFVNGVSESDALKIQAMIDQWENEDEDNNEDTAGCSSD